MGNKMRWFFLCIMFPPAQKMDKLRNSTHEAFAAFACCISLTAEAKPRRKRSDRDFSRMLIVMSVKPTLTDELLKVNSSLQIIFSVIEDQCSGGQ